MVQTSASPYSFAVFFLVFMVTSLFRLTNMYWVWFVFQGCACWNCWNCWTIQMLNMVRKGWQICIEFGWLFRGMFNQNMWKLFKYGLKRLTLSLGGFSRGLNKLVEAFQMWHEQVDKKSIQFMYSTAALN